MERMNTEKALLDIGLTNAESKIYLSLLKLGKSKAGKIIKSTGLQSSVVHNGLNMLLEKGFIGYIVIGSVREYHALDPKIIEDYLESKKLEFHKTIPYFKSLQTIKDFSSAEIYEGYAGILSAMLIMVSEAKRGEVFKYFAASEELLTDASLQFFARADLIRKEKGVKIKGIAPAANKKLKEYHHSEIKFTNQYIPPAMNIFNDKVLIISLENKPSAILITSRDISNQFHLLWNSIWKMSR